MKHFHRLFYPPAWPIAAKISVALVCAVLIPMIFTAYYNLQQSLNSVEAGEYHKLELLASSSASRLDQLIIDYHRVVTQISSDRYVVDFLAATTSQNRQAQGSNLEQTIQNVFRSHPNLDVVLLMDKNGQCLAATDPKLIGKNYSHIQGKLYGSGVLLSETSNTPEMFFSQPVRSHGEIIGFTLIKIRQADIWVIINALQLLDSQNQVFVIDQQGIIISHPDASLLNHSLIPLSTKTPKQVDQIESLDIPELAVMVKAKQPGHTTYHLEKSQTSEIVGFAPLATQPWVLGVTQPKAEFIAPLHRLIWLNSSSVVIVGGITAIIALLLGLSISRPIHALTAAAQALEDDNFDAHVIELHHNLEKLSHSQDDIGQLVRVFLKMAEEVRLRDQKLKMQVQELQIEIDQTKRAKDVLEITEHENFQYLQQTIQKLKQQEINTRESEKEYYQRLQTQVKSLKERSLNNKKLES
ncbi:cache domain-containing protein [Anabaena subtropica]|uniref:HAMP domain-containing protein n=1 Tax=Anabaena subtropica FACHB-260 TaxID=2692884 RepID=A0ABR8CKI5_9NOST|nr:cache domain-containing protein [Anabaena subtropica]MBD2342612.1 HAMP domain-containing protein [Anabaena subtropica FACHB-260]